MCPRICCMLTQIQQESWNKIKAVFLTFSRQLFGVSEDESVQKSDEGEVLQRVTRVLDRPSLWKQRIKLLMNKQHVYRENKQRI